MTRSEMAGMVSAVAVAAVLAGGIVQAQTPGTAQDAPQQERRSPGGPGRHFGWGGPFDGGFGRGLGGPMGLLRGLDLTDEQRTQIRDLLRGHQAEHQAIAEKLRAAHREQDAAIAATPFDEQAVRTKAADVAAVMADAAVLRARVHSEVFAVLTPEQQAKAAELKAQREARRDQVREHVKQRRQQRLQQRQQRLQQRAQPDAL